MRRAANPPATPPARLVERARELGRNLTQKDWDRLDQDERYALIKLGGEAKPSHNLEAALLEFERELKLSVVDQSPVSAGFTPADALRNTIELARLADRLGYERYWIAEHHGMETLASPSPEILISRLGAETSGIRVGSGGVMLPHYSPMKVAETFRMLHALYPNRIDLGVGRAPGGSPLETLALMRDRSRRQLADDFPQQLTELLAFLNKSFPENHPFSRIKLSPDMPGGPEVWLLGSSLWSASAAAQIGLPYASAHFIDQRSTRPALEYYRSHFTPSDYLSGPRALIALGAICADTAAEAQRLSASSRLLIRRIRQGDTRPVPTPEEALKRVGPGARCSAAGQRVPALLCGNPG